MAGIAFGYQIGSDFVKTVKSHFWQSADCTILTSRINEKKNFRCDVTYRYQIAGRTYTSSTLKDKYDGSDDYYDAQKLQEKYPARTKSVCLVNPADPTQAILQANSLWTGLGLLFPLPFIFIGGGLLYVIWRTPRPVQPAVKIKHPKTAQGIFFALFFAAGVAVMAFLIPMIQRGRAANSWPQIPCTVVRSGVASHTSQGRHGSHTTYNVTVLFRYTYQGKRHSSSRYAIVNSSTSNYAGQQKIADDLSHTKKRTCFVNPADPDDAVLDRSIVGATIIMGVVSLLFILVGGFGLRWVLHAAQLEHRQKIETHLSPNARGPAELKPVISIGVSYARLLFGPLIWNALMGSILYLTITDWQSSGSGLPWIIYASLFEVIGILWMVQAILKFRILFYPGARILIDQRPVSAGKEAEIRWQMTGDTTRITHLKLSVGAYKLTDSQVGIPALRNINPYWTTDLIDTTTSIDIATGRRKFVIPPDQLDARGQRIIWAILVDADLNKPATVQQEFPFSVTDATSSAH